MSASSANHPLRLKTFQLVACPHCNLNFRFHRTITPQIDECGFENHCLEYPRCDAPLRGIIDPADDKLLISQTEPQN